MVTDIYSYFLLIFLLFFLYLTFLTLHLHQNQTYFHTPLLPLLHSFLNLNLTLTLTLTFFIISFLPVFTFFFLLLIFFLLSLTFYFTFFFSTFQKGGAKQLKIFLYYFVYTIYYGKCYNNKV